MIKHLPSAVALGGLLVLAMPTNASAHSTTSSHSCAAGQTTVQILGSAGPRFDAERASSSYLLWVGGKARMLVDMGGGAYLRFGQSNAKLSDLAMVGISHLHPDHVSDLPAFLWLSHAMRKETLPIFGPSAGKGVPSARGIDYAPDFKTFLSRLFDPNTGAFMVMGGTLGAKKRNGVRLDVGVIDVLKSEPSAVFEGKGLKVTAIGIPHANMPTLAYRVETSDGSVVFSSDQTGTNPTFAKFAKNANVLIMHMQTPVGAKNPLHAEPAVVGRVAQEAQVGRLIVSHIGTKGAKLKAAVEDIKKVYKGPVTVGADLQCTPVMR
ncbi:MAG: MBL fold metallo-hydrolase [Proteobacteria bacterium]|nr:MBL fold metallo-hydrolase [Pseudomonadota bacterium]